MKNSIRYIPLLIGIAYLSEIHLELPLQVVISLFVLSFLGIITITEIRRDYREGRLPQDSNIPSSHNILQIVIMSSLLLSLVCGAIISHSPLVIMLAGITAILTLQKLPYKFALPELRGMWSFLWLATATMGGHIIYWNYLSVFEHKWFFYVESIIIKVVSKFLPIFSSSVIGQHIVISGQPINITAVDIHLGLPVIFAFFVLSKDSNVIRLIKAFVAICGIIILGFLWVLLVLYIDQPQLFFSNVNYFIMLIGSYLLVMILWRSSTLDFAVQIREIMICIIIAICLYAFPNSVRWMSSSKINKVAIDESHGSWETTQVTFDTIDYGRDTVYNYALFRQCLESMYDVRLLTEGITNIDADLLIIKTPVKFYSQEEKRVIENFVRSGGVLLVIGDHTNLFGHAMVINDLLDWTGLRLNSDAAISLATRHYDFKPYWWNRHHILHGINSIEFQTSATISASTPYVFPFIVGNQIVAEEADYSNDRFFGELTPDVSDRQPPLVLGAYSYVGDGKVILFGDSTIWSNFSFFAATNEALLENLLYSCHIMVGSTFRLLILFTVLGIFIMVYLFCRDWTHSLMIFLIVPALTFAWYGNSLDAAGVLDTEGNGNRVFLDGIHSNVELRADIRKGTKDDLLDYSTFYAWLSRIGLFPRIVKSYCYESPNIPVIIINPDKPFSNFEIIQIDTYLRRGGHILLIDDPIFAPHSTADSLLEHFGIFYKLEFSDSGTYDPEGPDLSENLLGIPFDILYDGKMSRGMLRTSKSGINYCLSGTAALLVDEEGFVICGQKEVGNGVIVVFYRSSIFSEFIMGDVWGGKEPGETKLQIYNLAYSLVNSSIGRKAK